MRKVCFDTELTDQQAQTKLESVFNNEIEFEDVMFIKYSKSFDLRTKQWDDPLVRFNRKKLFDFFNIEIRLNQKTKGTSLKSGFSGEKHGVVVFKTVTKRFILRCNCR